MRARFHPIVWTFYERHPEMYLQPFPVTPPILKSHAYRGRIFRRGLGHDAQLFAANGLCVSAY